MNTFTFEHTHKFTEKEYVELMRLLSKSNKFLRRAVVLLIGIACLFWVYTFLFGVLLILCIILIPILIRTIPGAAANSYKKMYILRAENLYGVNEKELWMKNNKAFSKISWKLISLWDERTGWLRIVSETNQNFWFPISELKNAGVYQNVIELCKANAKRYDSNGNVISHITQKA